MAELLTDVRVPGRTTLRIRVDQPGVLEVVQEHATRSQPMRFTVRQVEAWPAKKPKRGADG